MMGYDFAHVSIVTSRLKNIKELDAELTSVNKAPHTHDHNFTMTYNPQENLLDFVNKQNTSKIEAPHHNVTHNFPEEKITPNAVHILRRRRIIAQISKITQL